MSRATDQVRWVARQCVSRAKDTLGTGWAHVSDDIRWGLVAANVLGVMQGQDESIPAERVVSMTAAISACAREILDGERAP